MSSQVLPQLPAHIEARIFNSLSPNDIACTIRLVSKAAAAHFNAPEHKIIRLSQPVPYHALALEFGPDAPAIRLLSLTKRCRLLCLIAASGILANFNLALECAGCSPTCDMLEAAAAAGHRHICQRLRALGCPWGQSLRAAAEAGRHDMCEWLLATGHHPIPAAVVAAARAGHVDLMDSLLQRAPHQRRQVGAARLLQAAAEGCDLETFQRLYAEHLQVNPALQATVAAAGLPAAMALNWHGGHDATLRFVGGVQDSILAAAAGSPTPDWRQKVEWLEALEYPRLNTCAAAAALPDAVERLAWLRARGYPAGEEAVVAAAGAGNVPALVYLLDEAGARVFTSRPACVAAGRGGLAALRALHAHGGFVVDGVGPPEPLLAAARGGHVEAVTWLVEVLGHVEAVLGAEVAAAAAGSGSVQLLTWLGGQGCGGMRSGATALSAVVHGCVAALEWLVERGCPLEDCAAAYDRAARNGDLAMLRCLRRLGCPWDSSENFLSLCLESRVPLAGLRWLVEEGCPVDWRAALQAAERCAGGDGRLDVVAWVREQAAQDGVGLQEEEEEEEQLPCEVWGGVTDLVHAGWS